MVKSPKLYFYDTGLVCFLLGIENEQQLATHPLRGAIFENMVVLEFFKNRYNQGKLPHLYFYRDKSQHEVDLIEEKGTKLYSTQVIYDGENDIYISENGMVNFRNIKFED